eukprot:1177131-Prorocentrum_minimum.AAC.3
MSVSSPSPPHTHHGAPFKTAFVIENMLSRRMHFASRSLWRSLQAPSSFSLNPPRPYPRTFAGVP